MEAHRRLICVLLLLNLTGGCEDNAGPDRDSQAADPVGNEIGWSSERGFSGTVAETFDADRYTYVRVDTGEESVWVAAPKFTVDVGDRVRVPPGPLMTDFHSPSLDRDFAEIYFVAAVERPGIAMPGPGVRGPLPTGHPLLLGSETPAGLSGDPTVGGTQPGEDPTTGIGEIPKAEGGVTIGEIFAQKNALNGQEILVRGKVVKFNGGILGTNWLHLQDGTGTEGSHDLTVTSSAMVEVGDTVLVRGAVSLDRDFGSGYRYSVLVEDASVTAE